MQTFISPIGFNTTSVTRSLLEYGIDSEDTVQLVRPTTETDDNRAAEAVEDVERLLQEIEPTVTVTVQELPHDDFETAVMACSDLISTAPDDVVVSLSGGARDVLLPLTVAAMAHQPSITATLGYSDIDGKVRERLLPNITTTPSDGATETLAAVNAATDATSIPELTAQLDAAKSTITRHVNELVAADLLTAWTNERTKHVSITLSGRLYLQTAPER